MGLPYPGMDAVPFTPLTAEFLDSMIANIESLSEGSGFDTGVISTATIADGSVTTAKLFDANVTTAKLASTSVTAPKIDFNSFYTNFDTSYTSGSGMTLSSVNIRKYGGTPGLLLVSFACTLSAAVDDTGTTLFTLDLSGMGISSLMQQYPNFYSDGGNAITQGSVSTSGVVNSVGNEPQTLAIGNVINGSFISLTF